MLPFIFRKLFQKNKVTIVLYHDLSISNAVYQFESLKIKYNFISLSDFLRYKKDPSKNSLPEYPLIITFDDGRKGNYELLPIILANNIPVTIFLCSGIVATNKGFWFNNISQKEDRHLKRIKDEARLRILSEKYNFNENQNLEDRQALSFDEISEMMPYIKFQSHTIYHSILSQCSDEKAKFEICNSKLELENKFGIKINAIAFPNGNYTEREISYAKNSGYDCALTVDFGFNDVSTDPYRLKRICLSDNSSVDELIVKVSGVWGFFKSLFKFNLSI